MALKNESQNRWAVNYYYELLDNPKKRRRSFYMQQIHCPTHSVARTKAMVELNKFLGRHEKFKQFRIVGIQRMKPGANSTWAQGGPPGNSIGQPGGEPVPVPQ